jgi:hypothetical protein
LVLYTPYKIGGKGQSLSCVVDAVSPDYDGVKLVQYLKKNNIIVFYLVKKRKDKVKIWIYNSIKYTQRKNHEKGGGLYATHLSTSKLFNN